MTINISKGMIFVIIILLLNLFIYPASSQTAGEWVKKGNELIKSGESEKAVEALNKAIAINPKEKSAWFHKGNALSSLNEYDKAIEAYDRALAIDPNYKEAWLGKGATFAKVGNSKKVFEAIDMAIAIDPNYEDAWISKGLAHWDFKEYEKAVEAFDRELTINPNLGVAWGFKGEVLNDWGEYEKAIEAFDKAITFDQNDKYSWYGKGFALYKLGRYKDSIEAFDRAIAIDPSLEDEKGFREFAMKKMDEQTTSTQSDGQENKWIIISGIAIFIIIGIIALRNRKNNSNNDTLKNPNNMDYKINKWKMFCQKCGAELKEDSKFCSSCGVTLQDGIATEDEKGWRSSREVGGKKVNNWKILAYVIFTWLGIAIIAKAIVLSDPENSPELIIVTSGLYAVFSLILGIIMAYRLKKKIEFVYGLALSLFGASIIIDVLGGIGILLMLMYFARSYVDLERQRLIEIGKTHLG